MTREPWVLVLPIFGLTDGRLARKLTLLDLLHAWSVFAKLWYCRKELAEFMDMRAKFNFFSPASGSFLHESHSVPVASALGAISGQHTKASTIPPRQTMSHDF